MLSSRQKDNPSQPWQLLLLLLLATLSLCLACRVSEFSCKGSGNSGNICVPLDKYCDGRSDCADGSDEPKHCSGECGMCQLQASNSCSHTFLYTSLRISTSLSGWNTHQQSAIGHTMVILDAPMP